MFRDLPPFFFKAAVTKREFKRGEASFLIFFPLPYQGRGIKGVGCQINSKGIGFKTF